jgi:hypothetical protein
LLSGRSVSRHATRSSSLIGSVISRALPSYFPTFLNLVSTVLLPFIRWRFPNLHGSGKRLLLEELDFSPLLEDVRVEGQHVVVSQENPAGYLRLWVTILLAAFKVYGLRMLASATQTVFGFARELIRHIRTIDQSPQEIEAVERQLNEMVDEIVEEGAKAFDTLEEGF